MKAFVAAMAMWLCCVAAQPRQVFSATVKEAGEVSRWVSAKFLAKPQSVPQDAYLFVYTRNGLIEKNAIAGQPLRIAAQQYQRGLHFGAGKIQVRLPQPAKNLYAVLGPDSNNDDLGYGGRGSFVLSVEARGAELFRSSVMREGMAGVPINVNLAGAREFTLELKPVGERKPWDDAASIVVRFPLAWCMTRPATWRSTLTRRCGKPSPTFSRPSPVSAPPTKRSRFFGTRACPFPLAFTTTFGR
jgi:hypothetical protein